MTRSSTAVKNSATANNILDAAMFSFGTRGYQATSLDQLAAGLGVRKQTILYWFPSKEALLTAVVDRCGSQLIEVFESALSTAGTGWERVEAIVRATFRLAASRPELLGFVREVSRLGSSAPARLTHGMRPLLDRATEFLESEMEAGTIRRYDARFFLLSTYSVVIGVATEIEVLRALDMELTPRALVRRRNEVIAFLKTALLPS